MAVDVLGVTVPTTWLLAIVAVVLYFINDFWCRSYWARHGLKSPKSVPAFGNVLSWRKGIQNAFQDYAKQCGKFYGLYEFHRPILCVADVDALRTIMVKEFNSFYNRMKFNLVGELMSKGVFFMEDEHWRDVRGILSPTFSASKLKYMSHIMNGCADNLIVNIEQRQKQDGHINCRKEFGAFVMDTVASCAFGLNIDSQKNPDDPFVRHVRKIFDVDFFSSPLNVIVSTIPFAEAVLDRLGFTVFGRGTFDFFTDVIQKTIALRRNIPLADSKGKALDYLQIILNSQNANDQQQQQQQQPEKVEGGDINDNVIRQSDFDFCQKSGKKKIPLTETEIIANALLFFIAGFETTNTVTGFLAYELAMNPEIQQRLIEEVDEIAPTRESVGYSAIAKMPYLHQAFCEALRMYPPAAFTNRSCTKPYKLNGFTIPKGMSIFIPIFAIHHDPSIWPEPDRFDPDRFTKENMDKRHPFAWMPFGAGPRTCLGMRFAIMESKMMIIRVLQKFTLETCPQTEIPPVLGIRASISPPNGIILRAIKRQK